MNRLSFLACCACCILLAGCAGDPSATSDDGSPEFARAPATPAVASTDPSGARQDTTLDVHVLGRGFDNGSKVDFVRDGVVDPKLHVNKVTYKTGSELIANVTIAADAETVPYDVAVTTSKGKKGIGTELFTVNVAMELLISPSGTSYVNGVSPTGLLTGRVTTSCGTFAPALWGRTGQRTDLPAPAGACGGIGQAVNSSGVVVGTAYNGSQPAGPVRWLPSGGGYVVERLPMLPDGKDPGPWSVNDSGWISSGNAAAVWANGAGWRMLATPSGATSCFYTTIGNSGQVVGSCRISGVTQPVFWDSVTATPAVLPLPLRGTAGYPRGLNAGGTIVGFVTATDIAYRAVRWTRSGAVWTAEILPDLGKGGSAMAINSSGEIAGSVNGTNGFARPVFWDTDQAVHVLDTGDRTGEALGISDRDSGLVVGGYFVSSSKSGKLAVRWEP